MNPNACLAQCFPRRLHAICLAAIGTAFAVAAVGAHAGSIKIGGTGTGLGAMTSMAQEFNKSRPDARIIVTPSLGSAGAIRAVLAGAVDVGISARPVTAEEIRQGLSALALDGVMPTLQTLAAGHYRHFKTLYLVTGREPSKLAKDFVAFVHSPAGRAVLAKSGNLALPD